MTNTPLFCPCGTRLGLRRQDGTYFSRHVGREYELAPGSKLRCQECGQQTEVDKLAVGELKTG